MKQGFEFLCVWGAGSCENEYYRSVSSKSRLPLEKLRLEYLRLSDIVDAADAIFAYPVLFNVFIELLSLGWEGDMRVGIPSASRRSFEAWAGST